MNILKRVGWIGLMGVMLCAGCEQKTATQSPKQPITGAFGYTLGERLADSYQLETNALGELYADGTKTNAPLDTIYVTVLPDRTIYGIHATIHMDNYDADIKILEDLESKYGAPHIEGEGRTRTYIYGRPDDTMTHPTVKGRTLHYHLTSTGLFSLFYVDEKIMDQIKAEKQAQKDKALTEKLSGL